VRALQSDPTIFTARAMLMRPSNRLLAALPATDYARLAPELRPISLPAKQRLERQDEPIEDIYFLDRGACSVVRVMSDGQMAEVASIGNEGAIGASAFFGESHAMGDTRVYPSGATGCAIKLNAFHAEMDRRGALYNLIIRYSQALTAQLMQTTACNGVHLAEQRCCRWLLTTSHRLQTDEFPVTQEFIAAMLGLRRPTITLLVGALQHAGVIDYRRGFLRITDHAQLLRTACECYETITASHRRLYPQSPMGSSSF
jgi:CRP-like cAMP-binding protein